MNLWKRFRVWLARRYNWMCPYNGVAYWRVPGYTDDMHACPVCNGINWGHRRLKKKHEQHPR